MLIFILGGCSSSSSDDVDLSNTDVKTEELETESETAGTEEEEAGPQEQTNIANCAPLPQVEGNRIILGPEQVGDLQSTVSSALTGDTILLKDGTYELNGSFLWFSVPGVTLRSFSGNPESVILDGDYITTEIITVAASNVTIAELTITQPYTHAIHVTSSAAGDTLNTKIYRVNVIDPREQAIKINVHSGGGTYPDEGEIACSNLKLTDSGRPQVNPVSGGCYTGGIDAHQSKGWTIRDNEIEGFWCENGLAEHAIHLWRGSRDTIVERNTMTNNARGVGFGLASSGSARVYNDNACPQSSDKYVGHYNGIIRNNFIYANSQSLMNSASGFDCGICLWSACGAKVVHNTIVSTDSIFSSIEWRFAGSQGIEISNNIATHNLRERNGAKGTLLNNLEGASLSLFLNAGSGDLHLNSDANEAINQGAVLPSGLSDEDFDQETRDAEPDIGADEVIQKDH